MTDLGKVISYGCVSGACLVVHNAVMISSERLQYPLALGFAVSFGLVVALGYILHGAYTFARPLSWIGFMRYAIAVSGSIPLSFACLWFALHLLRLPMWSAAPVASCGLSALTFLLSHWAFGGRAAHPTSWRLP